jgi:hypothetical protein
VSRHDPFFWDTVQLGAKHAHFFYENGLKWLPLPTSIDSGHPPVFGYYLAIVWTLLGKSLLASHLAILPFLLMNVWLLWEIGHKLGGKIWGPWLPLLVMLDPVLLGQSVMISPDVVLVTSFLLALEGIIGQQKWMLVFGILGLCAISMRGMMTAAAFLAWVGLLPFLKDFDLKKLLISGLPFVPGFAFAALFLCWHWNATGWIGFHSNSPWAAAFQRVGYAGFFRNIAIAGWRWLDFGRVGELLVLAGLFSAPAPKQDNHRVYGILSLLCCLLLFLLPSALLYQNLSAHRYFLPAFLSCHLLVFQWITGIRGLDYGVGNVKKWLLGAVFFCLATGNLWIYPRGISMDWDSTLAHWPYHALRQEALLFLEEKNVDFAMVGSAFPNLNTGENLLLNGDQRQFSKKDFAQNHYIFASNIFNDFSEADYTVLGRDWDLIWEKKKGWVWIEIYERRE